MLSRNRGPFIIAQAARLNVLILMFVILAHFSPAAAAIGTIAFVLGFFIFTLHKPTEMFFLLFGIKLTYDALWFVKIPFPGLSNIGMLEIFLLPVIALIVTGPKLGARRYSSVLTCVFIYILWIIFAIFLNGYGFNLETVVRESGILFGLILGLKYIKTDYDIKLIVYLIFVSTAIPVFAGLFQLLTGYLQIDLALFHFKFESVRGIRPSGLYYDAGTAGMVYLMSAISNLYIIFTPDTPQRYRRFLGAFFVGVIILLFAGGTMSMIVSMSGIIAFLMMKAKGPGRILFVALSAALVVLLFSSAFPEIPYIGTIAQKIDSELGWLRQGSGLENLSTDPAYGHLLTGRVGLWQDIWEKYKSGTLLQQLFGAGLGRGGKSHSTYFHLLQQIGFLGLIFYIVLHWRIMTALFRIDRRKMIKYIAILSLGWVLLIGISLTTVVFTSFQWFIYMLVGAALNIGYPVSDDGTYSLGIDTKLVSDNSRELTWLQGRRIRWETSTR